MWSFDVPVEALHAGAESLARDAEAVQVVAEAAVGAVRSAGSAAGGGALAQASADFTRALDEWSAQCVAAVRGSGATVAANARRYASTDAAAMASLGVVGFEQGSGAGPVTPVEGAR